MLKLLRKYGVVLIPTILFGVVTIAPFSIGKFAGIAESFAANQPTVVQYAMTTEPPNLNGMVATDGVSFFLLGHIMEGLMRYDSAGKIVGGVAEKFSVSDKGAKFTIRKDAKWSDGKPVTAKDFVYAWRTVVDPKTASDYAFIVYSVKNAEAINQGKMPIDKLGVKATSDTELEVEFERPCGYFLALMSFPTFFPVREDIHKQFGAKFAAEASNFVFNGPFTLTSWVHGASLKLAKNPNYWGASRIKLTEIDIPYITAEEMPRFNLFRDKKIQITSLNKELISEAQKANLKLNKFSDGYYHYLGLNFREGRPTVNLELRKALKLAINKDDYVRSVVGIPGTPPGLGIVPSFMPGATSTFRKDFVLSNEKQNLAEAKKLIEAARTKLGGQIPALIWLCTDTPQSAKEAEYFQALFKRELGIEIKIDRQIFKQRLAKMRAGEFDIVSTRWGPDYADPMTFMDLFASWNDNNVGPYKNAKFDALIHEAMGTVDQKARMKAMANAEKIALDEVALIPLYENTVIYVQDEKLKNVVRRQVGFDPDLREAYFE